MPSDGKANLRYLGLKNSIFSRLAGAAPQAGVTMRLKAGAARLFTVVHDSATAFRITTLPSGRFYTYSFSFSLRRLWRVLRAGTLRGRYLVVRRAERRAEDAARGCVLRARVCRERGYS